MGKFVYTKRYTWVIETQGPDGYWEPCDQTHPTRKAARRHAALIRDSLLHKTRVVDYRPKGYPRVH